MPWIRSPHTKFNEDSVYLVTGRTLQMIEAVYLELCEHGMANKHTDHATKTMECVFMSELNSPIEAENYGR